MYTIEYSPTNDLFITHYYENHDCEVHGNCDDSQEHISNCKVILNMRELSWISEIPEYLFYFKLT